VTPLFTLKSCTVLLALSMTLRPVPSKIVSADIVLRPVNLMAPSQAKVTVPPPDKAEFKPASLQVETVPPAWVMAGKQMALSTRPTQKDRVIEWKRMIFSF
jgi:hypothetical protein